MKIKQKKDLFNFLVDSSITIFIEVSVTKGIAEDEEAIFNVNGDGLLRATIIAENDAIIIEASVVIDSGDYYLKKGDSILIEISLFDLINVNLDGEKYLIEADLISYIFTNTLEKHE
ncbi:MAG: hypothetical protein GY858_01760 [Candidatus Omnitrophica bacterium]|nr:hypothetical protein [Candidatus Omnitrophota bacterium]